LCKHPEHVANEQAFRKLVNLGIRCHVAGCGWPAKAAAEKAQVPSESENEL